MAISSTALATEIQTDPTLLGYAAFIGAADQDGQIAGLLNLPRASIQVFKSSVPSTAVAASLIKADWDALAAGDKQLFAALLEVQTFDLTSSSLRSLMGALFPVGSGTRTNLLAVAQRNGSRAEQLFGVNTTVSPIDVAAALGRP